MWRFLFLALLAEVSFAKVLTEDKLKTGKAVFPTNFDDIEKKTGRPIVKPDHILYRDSYELDDGGIIKEPILHKPFLHKRLTKPVVTAEEVREPFFEDFDFDDLKDRVREKLVSLKIVTYALEEHDGKDAVGDRNITNLQFADDIDALAEEEQEVEALAESSGKTCTRYKMDIIAETTKLMTNSANGTQRLIKAKEQQLGETGAHPYHFHVSAYQSWTLTADLEKETQLDKLIETDNVDKRRKVCILAVHRTLYHVAEFKKTGEMAELALKNRRQVKRLVKKVMDLPVKLDIREEEEDIKEVEKEMNLPFTRLTPKLRQTKRELVRECGDKYPVFA